MSGSGGKREVLAVIPARGGSKGVPGKNVRLLAGRPLIGHTIAAALEASRVTRVIVSTDDAQIAAAARAAGAEVSERPAAISGDKAASEAAIIDVLDQLTRAEGYAPEIVVFLQCTSPLTTSDDIDATVSTLLDEKADSALSVSRFHHFVWSRDGSGSAEGINHDKRVRQMRQDRDEQFLENGAIYAFRTAGFLRDRHRFFGKVAMHVMPAERTLEIDSPYDFELAERAMRRQDERSNRDLLPGGIAAIAFDFDGVFTDNGVYIQQDGTEAVRCDRGDGMGLGMLKQAGVPMIVLSKEVNPVVAARCAKLDLPFVQGLDSKMESLRAWSARIGVPLEKVAYVGNDVNDLECMAAVGCSVAVADSVPEVIVSARIVLSALGGRGAIRELAGLMLTKSKNAK